MESDLRVPLTAAQKASIRLAAINFPGGMAGWARSLLLPAAESVERLEAGGALLDLKPTADRSEKSAPTRQLCHRCQRVGAIKDCPDCAALE